MTCPRAYSETRTETGLKARQKQRQGLPWGVLRPSPAIPIDQLFPPWMFYRMCYVNTASSPTFNHMADPKPLLCRNSGALLNPGTPTLSSRLIPPRGIRRNHRKAASFTTIIVLTPRSLEQAENCPQSRVKETCPRSHSRNQSRDLQSHSRDKSRPPGTFALANPCQETFGEDTCF